MDGRLNEFHAIGQMEFVWMGPCLAVSKLFLWENRWIGSVNGQPIQLTIRYLNVSSQKTSSRSIQIRPFNLCASLCTAAQHSTPQVVCPFMFASNRQLDVHTEGNIYILFYNQ